MTVLIATDREVLILGEGGDAMRAAEGLDGHRPTCLAADPLVPGRAWCGTHAGGVFRSDDGGRSWRAVGLEDRRPLSVGPSPAEKDLVWVGTEPSEVWRSADAGGSWERAEGLEALPSSEEWSFPPKPHTHHVRWIACHPRDPGRLWVAIEAGALVSTMDGGRTWRDRVPGGPFDTHELAIHPEQPDVLRVSAGDGYFESRDGGDTWVSPEEGLEVTYLRSVAMDPGRPDIVIVSAASHAHAAYVAGRSDGRLLRREGNGAWKRVRDGWPDPPNTIAPLLTAGAAAGELLAADERGVHRSDDGGVTWRLAASFPKRPSHLRGLAWTR